MDKLLTRAEYDIWYKQIPGTTCTFCQWNKYQNVIHEFKHWIWIENKAPYWYFHTMFVPKRHFEREEEMTLSEMADLIEAKQYAFDTVTKAKLVFPSGKLKGLPVEKFVYFHRYRQNRFDSVSGAMRPSHYHDHFSPDIDHRWDSTLDTDAVKYPIHKYL